MLQNNNTKELMREAMMNAQFMHMNTPVQKPMLPNNDTISETIQQRGQIYGEPHHSHTNIGLSWTGILQQHYGITLPTAIPPHIVELMMVAFKVQRSTRVYHPDNYVDLAAYARFAEHAQSKPGEPFE